MERNIRYLKAEQNNDGRVYAEISFWSENDICCGIYRKECPDFVFDYDGMEYFDRQSITDAALVFEGPIQDNYSEFIYKDYTVLSGKVYAYWVVYKGMPVGPAAVRIRDERVCIPESILAEKIQRLSCLVGLETLTVGKTVQHRPLTALLTGNRQNAICCFGAVHAGEAGPEILLTALERIIKESPELLQKAGICILPAVNLDLRRKMAAGSPIYHRKNANGVDLNRNFPADWEQTTYSYRLSSAAPGSDTYRGPYPESEPETKAAMHLIECVRPKLVFSYHWLGSITGDTMLSPPKTVGSAAEKATNEVAQQYSAAFRDGAKLPAREIHAVDGQTTPGSLPLWAERTGNCIAFDLEGCSIPEFDACRQDKADYAMLCRVIDGHTAALRAMLQLLGQWNAV